MIFDLRCLVTQEFDELCRELEVVKGKSYATEADALANFKRIAERLGLTPWQVLAIYFNKHVDSFNNAVKANPQAPVDASESLMGRFMDMSIYIKIAYALAVEQGLIKSKVYEEHDPT
jgi:hypothetical protein